jgi:3-mercaptopyruvate sulfurtransferase SseA
MKKFVGKILAFASVSLLLLTQACSAPTPAATAYPNPYPNPTPATAESVVRVSLADAKSAFDAKTAVFLDVRDAGSYAEAHIPGALNIPLNELEARLDELDPNAWIITYCT